MEYIDQIPFSLFTDLPDLTTFFLASRMNQSMTRAAGQTQHSVLSVVFRLAIPFFKDGRLHPWMIARLSARGRV